MSVTTEKKHYRKPNTKPIIEHVGMRNLRPRPRESSYHPSCDEMATRFCLLGANNAELGRCLGVCEATVKLWLNKYPSFNDAVKAGRTEADANVANSTYRRAVGYSHTAEKVVITKKGEVVRAEYTEHYPPDTSAARYWLNNRRPTMWRDTPPVLVQNNNSQTVAVGSDPVQIGQNYQQIMDAEE